MAAASASFSPLANIINKPSEWSNDVRAAVIIALSVVVFSAVLLRPSYDGKVYDLGGIPILTVWSFFTKRYDFIREQFKNSGGKTFRFRVLQHRVIAFNGEQSRKVYFNEAGFSMSEGYRILMGGAPELKDAHVQSSVTDADIEDGFIKRLLLLLRRDRITDTLPTLLDDMHTRMTEWGTEGKINPFSQLVFQMTIRMATCKELAEDRKAMNDLAKHYWALEKSATPVSLLLPWFPGPAKRAKEKSTVALYNLFNSFVERRRNATVPSSDPIDLFIAQGDSNDTIIGVPCWTLLFLGSNPVWKKKVVDELKALVANHTDTLSSEPLHKRLAAIPLNAWEEQLPTIDLAIRETLRITATGSTLRRNMHKDVTVDGVTVKRGDFLTYQLADVHLNPEIYKDPMQFDPSRFLEGREEDRKETFAFIGWGVGRHPCAGMKIAKLEIKLILALILLGYEYELVDGSGKYPKQLPTPDRNDIQQARPLGEPCYMKFKKVAE
ncbi:Cytochrome P450 monooxygenase [Psilocybe cubensis]|uniref:Cytochrome P450 n=2 Tax=Psilocybe cubensis TaxID=181762 RepID=A0A8H8CJK5_PSICU|nr:Cytochrome P450 monooxygenase [Psilocybe cubensis]KAH9478207.1 Cytochrome P450 monooxygenase [Psilocybe cubensis]